MPPKPKHLLSTQSLKKSEIEEILALAKEMEPYARKEKQGTRMKGKILAALFYEPSTRTRLSFETAMKRLGGETLSVTDASTSSISKGESISDTAKVISQFADIVAIRHSQNGAAKEFSLGSEVPVINAGDGVSQHPSQALLDAYTIKKELGKINGLTVAISGDLKYGRTPNSLAFLLSNYNVKFRFISPKELKMKPDVIVHLNRMKIPYEETTKFEEGMRGVDVLYMTRVQKERFKNYREYERLKNVYVLNKKLVQKVNPKMLIMHPLPRVNEIAQDVDGLKNAAYFRQVENGIAVRMAIILTRLL
ncbi:aspartate carbamoyltransferase [Candidatus Peregrinibacteria bacterium]|nr:aspartate carbamoyltransferase [Candidatus Peregrinibacteria bacterium]